MGQTPLHLGLHAAEFELDCVGGSLRRAQPCLEGAQLFLTLGHGLHEGRGLLVGAGEGRDKSFDLAPQSRRVVLESSHIARLLLGTFGQSLPDPLERRQQELLREEIRADPVDDRLVHRFDGSACRAAADRLSAVAMVRAGVDLLAFGSTEVVDHRHRSAATWRNGEAIR